MKHGEGGQKLSSSQHQVLHLHSSPVAHTPSRPRKLGLVCLPIQPRPEGKSDTIRHLIALQATMASLWLAGSMSPRENHCAALTFLGIAICPGTSSLCSAHTGPARVKTICPHL